MQRLKRPSWQDCTGPELDTHPTRTLSSSRGLEYKTRHVLPQSPHRSPRTLSSGPRIHTHSTLLFALHTTRLAAHSFTYTPPHTATMFTKLALLSALTLAGLATLVVASPIRVPVSAPPLAPRHHHGHHGTDLATTVDQVTKDAVDNAAGGVVDSLGGDAVRAALGGSPDALAPREHQVRASGTLTARCGFLRHIIHRLGRRPGLPASPPTNGTSAISPAGPSPSSPVMPSGRPLPDSDTVEKRDSEGEGEPTESDDKVLSSSEPAEECDCCKDKPVLEGSLIIEGLISGLSGEGDIGLDSDMVPDVPQSDI